MKKIKIKNLFKNFYAIPLTYVLFFSTLALVLHLLDKNDFYTTQSNLLITSFTYGHDLYILMIGGLITLITISISLMMVVLTVYGAQFSPKTLQDFLSNKKTLHILGYLIGTLVYAITSLFLQDNLVDAKFLISPVFGTMFFVLSIFVFVFFIQFVSRSVQINIYIQQLGKDILKGIELKEKSILLDEKVHYKEDVIMTNITDKELISVSSKKSGYLHSYDRNGIIALAINSNCIVVSKKQIGEFIFEDDIIFEIYNLKENIEETQNQLANLIEVKEDYSSSNSLGFGTKKLTEIALRAVSTSTNDSATACFCIDQLGETFKGITNILAHVVYTDENNKLRLVAQQENFSRILYDHFSQIKKYGFNDLTIIKSTLSAFIKIAHNAKDRQNSDLWEFVKYMTEDINIKTMNKYDYEYIISDLYQISLQTDNIEEFKTLYKK